MSCEVGTVAGCEIYAQNLINMCIFYDNEIDINVDGECVELDVIPGCALYSSDRSSCDSCEAGKYYVADENICCDFGTYPLSGDTDTCTGTDTNNLNCSVF